MMMKTNLIILIMTLASLLARAQIVNIPDPNLKYNLITYPIADLGNGFNEIADTNGDGEIQVIEAEAVLGLQLIEQFIEDLEGLQYFTNLEWINIAQNTFLDYVPTTFWPNLSYLHCGQNDIPNLDITQNLLLEILIANGNPLTNIDVTQNSLLKDLSLSGCQLSNLDVSQNITLEILHCNGNQLTNLDLSQNINLHYLSAGNNLLTELDITNNINLYSLSCNDNLISSLDLSQNLLIENIYTYNNQLQLVDISTNINLNVLSCFNNQLLVLNLKNGFNNILTGMLSYDNPNLTCIQVDNVEYANNQSNWHKDETAIYSEDCNLSINENELQQFINVYPNPVKNILSIDNNKSIEIEKITVYDILGKVVLIENNSFNKLNLSDLNSGILFINIETENGTITKKIIKE